MKHVISLLLLFGLFFSLLNVLSAEETFLSELLPVSAAQGHGALGSNVGDGGKPLSVAGQSFQHGLGTHAKSRIVYDLGGQYSRFEANVGVDDAMKDYTDSSIVFQVFVDGKKLFDSGVMQINEPAKPVNVPLDNAETLELVVDDAGDGNTCDHAVWGNARLVGSTAMPQKIGRKAFSVGSPKLTLDLSADGQIVGFKTGQVSRPIHGQIRLRGCRNNGKTTVKRRDDGAEFSYIVKNQLGNQARITERFIPTDAGIRWEVKIVGLGNPWTTPIQRIWDYKITDTETDKNVKFWTAWSDPRCGINAPKDDTAQKQVDVMLSKKTADKWFDPLSPKEFSLLSAPVQLYYGLAPFDFASSSPNIPTTGNLFCIPLLSFLEDKNDFGITLAQSPADTLLDVTLSLLKTGKATMEYLNHRISKNSPVILRADIVPHEADWRGGLRYITKTFPEYFEPVNPKAHEIAGTATYTGSMDKICADAEKYRKMAYCVNWQASFDFPWFGMFIPPVTDDVEWTTFGKRQYTVKKFEEEAAMMKKNGFYTLNYFNVAEAGTYTKFPPPPRTTENINDLWKNGNDYLYEKLGDAILMQPKNPDAANGNRADFEGKPVFSWEGSVVMDCGVPSYRDFLLEQAKRHIEKIPSADGICIDRLDWLRYYNLKGNDGVSWFHNRPSRSFLVTWNQFLEPLGKIIHDANKVIYVNNLDKRIDALKNIDGVYCEYADHGTGLNLTAFCCLKCPALGWTRTPEDLQPDPDAYFQKFLYLGVYPSAPLEGNDHMIRSDPVADKHYADYGLMLEQIRGRTWVLEPHCITVKNPLADNSAVRVNLFRVPDGFVIPVAFADDAFVDVEIRNVLQIRGYTMVNEAKVFLPGEDKPVVIPTALSKDGTLQLHVPVKRGGAVVRLRVSRQ